MKRSFLLPLFLLFTLLLSAETFAMGPIHLIDTRYSKEFIENCYLEGLKSDNEGIRTSAALQLGYLKSTKAVIPLMKMMRDEQSDATRIIAALSLIRIGDTQGAYMVGRTALYNTSEKVRFFAEKFYYAYTHNFIDDVPYYEVYTN